MPTSRPAKALAATELAFDSGGQGGAVPSGVSIKLEPPDPTRPSTLAPGTIVAERYRIDEVLGEGGMGKVYAAEHVHMHKQVAIKVLHAEMSTTPEVVARFEREAVAAGKIDHPNVAAATDFGRLSDSSFFLVLERVVGSDLRAAIRTGPIAPARAAHIVRQIASAVGAAHAAGVVHRDLKPENIMLVERDGDPDFVKVLDFGIAKIDMVGIVDSKASTASSGAASQPLTRMGAVFGTPDYMSPEQALGQTVDLRSDLYSIGVMFYELLVGSRPFKGGAVTLMRAHVLDAVPTLPPDVIDVVGTAYDGVIQRLLQKSAPERYASAQELLDAIDELPSTALVSPLAAPSAPRSGAAAVALTPGPTSSPSMLTEEAVAPAPATRRRRSFGSLSWLVMLGACVAGAYGLIASPASVTDSLHDALGARAPAPSGSIAPDPVAVPAPTAEPAIAPPVDSAAQAEPDEPDDPAPLATTPGAPHAGPHLSQTRPASKPYHKTNKGSSSHGRPIIPPPSQWFKN